MNLSVRDFHLLDVLGREQHFGRTAEILGLRQPQLSIRIAQIERVLGLTLFQRRPRAMLTPEGAVIVEAARSAFADFDAAVERARRMAKGQVGAIVVAIASSVMLSDLPLAVQRFRHAYPGVALSLRDMNSGMQAEALQRGLIDISITREPVQGRSLRCEVLGRQRFVALLPRDHPLAGRGQLALAELAEEPFVLFNPAIAPGLLQQINALCLRAGFVPRVVQQAEEWYTVLGFVRAGFGVTVTLDVFGAAARSDVAACDLDDEQATSPVFIGWDEERQSSPRDLLADWLRAECAELSARR